MPGLVRAHTHSHARPTHTSETLFKYQLIQTNTRTAKSGWCETCHSDHLYALPPIRSRIVHYMSDKSVKRTVWVAIVNVQVIVPNWIPSMCRYFWKNIHVHIVNKIIFAPFPLAVHSHDGRYSLFVAVSRRVHPFDWECDDGFRHFNCLCGLCGCAFLPFPFPCYTNISRLHSLTPYPNIHTRTQW